VKHSTLADSSKRRALMRGPRLESDSALVSASLVQGGMSARSRYGHVETHWLPTKGNLRHWLFDPRRWCASTPDTNQELDKVSLRLFYDVLPTNAFTSIIFCEVVAIYGVVRSKLCSRSLQSSHSVSLDHRNCLFCQTDLCSGLRNVYSR
jgi:hypothetical protein